MADVWAHAVDEEDAAAERQFANQNDATAFLIDAGPAMLQPHTVPLDEQHDDVFGNSLSFLGLAIRLVEQTMRSKIISNENDAMSVTFYGTREKATVECCGDVPNLYTLQRGFPAALKACAELKDDEQAMDVPSAPRISQLSHLPPRFEECIGTDPACDREAALMHGVWTCGELVERAFKTKRGGGARRIIIITNDASPLRPGSAGTTVLERARLCKQTGTVVQVVPLVDGLGARGSLWAQLHNDPDAPPLGAPAASVETLRDRVRRKVHKKRRLCALEFIIAPGGAATRLDPAAAALAAAARGPSAAAGGAGADDDVAGVRIGVGLYSLVAAATKGTVVKVDRADFAAVKSVTRLMDPVTVTPLAPEHLARGLDYPATAGGAASGAAPHKLVLPTATAAALRRTGLAPGLRVLGFLPAARVGRAFAMRAPYFAYPDEGARPGSVAAFTALLRAMLHRDVAALAVLVRAPGAAPRLAALMPQAEERDGDDANEGGQRVPPGLHVVPLPWAEDVRGGVPAAVLPPARAGGADAAAEQEAAEAAARCARAAADVVRSVRLADFRCEDFPNPALQRYYSYLEALALAEDFTLEKDARDEDATLPSELPPHVAAAVDAFAAEVGRVGPHPEDVAGGGGGAGGAAAAASRKRKAEPGSAEAAEADAKRKAGAESVAALLAAGGEHLARATIAELKAYLAAAGLKQSGVKAELMERVLQHANDNAA